MLTYVQRSANGSNNSQHCWANIVSCCVSVGSGVLTDATTPNIVETYSASWEGCANGSNIVVLRFGDHRTKEILGVVG